MREQDTGSCSIGLNMASYRHLGHAGSGKLGHELGEPARGHALPDAPTTSLLRAQWTCHVALPPPTTREQTLSEYM